MNTLETLCVRVTKHCNLSCFHCRAGSSPITKEYIDIDELFKCFIKLQKIGLKHISISGGEPFLVKNIFEFIEQLISSDFNVTITSNGTIPRICNLSKIESLKTSKKLKVRFSLDGNDAENDRIRGGGVFNKCQSSIKSLQGLNNHISLNTVVYTWNFNSIISLINEFDKNLIGEWAFISPVQKGNGKNISSNANDYPKLLDNCEYELLQLGFEGIIKKWDFINSPYASALLNSNGDLVFTGIFEDKDIYITNIFKDPNMETTIESKVNSQKQNLNKSYFNWTKW